MKALRITAAILLITAFSQSAEGSEYCALPGATLMMGVMKEWGLDDSLAAIRGKCQPGDTIIIPGSETGVIASICNLSQSIVLRSGQVICVMVKEREAK